MSCEWVKDNLFDYLDGELGPSEGLILKEHLQTCTSCSREYEKALKAWEKLDSWEDLPPPKHLQLKILGSIRRRREIKWLNVLVPAAAVLLIITGLAFLYRGAYMNNYHEAAVCDETTPVRLQADITAENEADIISNLQLLREKEFYDSLDKLEKIDYLPLVEEETQEEDRRSSLELLTV
jgi:predicted anti-sigma-YlaC factor YlaD